MPTNNHGSLQCLQTTTAAYSAFKQPRQLTVPTNTAAYCAYKQPRQLTVPTATAAYSTYKQPRQPTAPTNNHGSLQYLQTTTAAYSAYKQPRQLTVPTSNHGSLQYLQTTTAAYSTYKQPRQLTVPTHNHGSLQCLHTTTAAYSAYTQPRKLTVPPHNHGSLQSERCADSVTDLVADGVQKLLDGGAARGDADEADDHRRLDGVGHGGGPRGHEGGHLGQDRRLAHAGLAVDHQGVTALFRQVLVHRHQWHLLTRTNVSSHKSFFFFFSFFFSFFFIDFTLPSLQPPHLPSLQPPPPPLPPSPHFLPPPPPQPTPSTFLLTVCNTLDRQSKLLFCRSILLMCSSYGVDFHSRICSSLSF